MRKSHALPPYTLLYRRYSETMSSALGRAPICFVRDRKFGPLQVVLTMQAAHFAGSQEGGQSWEDALDSAANSLSDDPVWRNRFRVSRAAFHQAIKKVDAEDQAQLWEVCRDMFPASADSSLSELHGIRFAHVDGTQVRTPRSDELLNVVGTQTNGPNQSCHFPVGKSVLMLEAGTQRILGHELCRCKAFDQEKEPILVREERAAWRVVRERITEKYAIIADSGFASHEDFAELIAEGKHFLVAVQKSWKIIAKFRATKQSDAIVTIAMPHDHSRTLTFLDSSSNKRRQDWSGALLLSGRYPRAKPCKRNGKNPRLYLEEHLKVTIQTADIPEFLKKKQSRVLSGVGHDYV
jgi:hypothetical protein